MVLLFVGKVSKQLGGSQKGTIFVPREEEELIELLKVEKGILRERRIMQFSIK